MVFMHLIVFPNQLYAKHPGLAQKPKRVVLIEDSLFFGDAHYPARFHKQKLWMHRSSMKRYQATLEKKGLATDYLEHIDAPESLRTQLQRLFKPCLLYTSDAADE